VTRQWLQYFGNYNDESTVAAAKCMALQKDDLCYSEFLEWVPGAASVLLHPPCLLEPRGLLVGRLRLTVLLSFLFLVQQQ